MSNVINVAESVNTTTMDVVEKKPRVSSLAAKYSNYIQFGYFLVKSIQDSSTDSLTTTQLLEQLHLYDSVENQQIFVQQYLDQSKDIKKTINKLVKDHKKAAIKAAKPVKEPKVKAESTRGRKKKVVQIIHNNKNDFVTKLVNAANNISTIEGSTIEGSTIEPETLVESSQTISTTETKTKKMKKNAIIEPVSESSQNVSTTEPKNKKMKKNAIIEPVSESSQNVSTTATTETKQSKKTKDSLSANVTERKSKKINNKPDVIIPVSTTPILLEDEPEEDDLEVEPFSLNGLDYLKDDNNTIYSIQSHEPIGLFDPINLSISLF